MTYFQCVSSLLGELIELAGQPKIRVNADSAITYTWTDRLYLEVGPESAGARRFAGGRSCDIVARGRFGRVCSVPCKGIMSPVDAACYLTE